MNYAFPEIVHIQQALDAIKGDEDLFYVVEKDGFTVINYKLPCNKTFPAVTDRNTAIRRELRGIKFCSETGKTLSRVLHKFFNAGEREETLLENIDITKKKIRLEKLDGSMVHPLKLNGYTRWATKMGVTDVSMQTEVAIASGKFDEAAAFSDYCLEQGFTPIFEWCSRKNRIVVDHPEDRLVLLAVRDIYTGSYWLHEDMAMSSIHYGFEVVQAYPDEDLTELEAYIENIHNHSGPLTEGEILRFVDGQMLKIKTQAYVNLHRTKDKIQKERNLVAVLLAGQLDDLKPFMLREDLENAEKYESQLNKNVNDLVSKITCLSTKLIWESVSRKDFSLTYDEEPIVKQIIFHLWDKPKDSNIIHEEVMRRLSDACEHEQKFERISGTLLRDCKW